MVVIGGGNSAIDAARTALRLGAEKVTVVYRRSREAMPAYEEEIEEAEHEGVQLKLLTAQSEIVLDGKRVAGLKCLPMQMGEFDRSGRRRPEEGGDAFVLPADQVLVAIGQSLDLQRICNSVALTTRSQGLIQVNPVNGQTSEKWIFAGGDAVSGPASVVEAVAAGERAAVGIDLYLTGQNHAFWREDRPGGHLVRPRCRALRRLARTAQPAAGRAAAEQFRRSRAALARIGGRAPGGPLPPLRLWKTLPGKPRRSGNTTLGVVRSRRLCFSITSLPFECVVMLKHNLRTTKSPNDD